MKLQRYGEKNSPAPIRHTSVSMDVAGAKGERVVNEGGIDEMAFVCFIQ